MDQKRPPIPAKNRMVDPAALVVPEWHLFFVALTKQIDELNEQLEVMQEAITELQGGP